MTYSPVPSSLKSLYPLIEKKASLLADNLLQKSHVASLPIGFHHFAPHLSGIKILTYSQGEKRLNIPPATIQSLSSSMAYMVFYRGNGSFSLNQKFGIYYILHRSSEKGLPWHHTRFALTTAVGKLLLTPYTFSLWQNTSYPLTLKEQADPLFPLGKGHFFHQLLHHGAQVFAKELLCPPPFIKALYPSLGFQRLWLKAQVPKDFLFQALQEENPFFNK